MTITWFTFLGHPVYVFIMAEVSYVSINLLNAGFCVFFSTNSAIKNDCFNECAKLFITSAEHRLSAMSHST